MISTDHLLTPDQVAQRWGTSPSVVWAAVDSEQHPLPFVYVGTGHPARGRRGKRGLYRFRLSTLAAWEAERERSFRQAEVVKVTMGKPSGWDGKIRGGARRGRAGR